jgi:hypothetical protein
MGFLTAWVFVLYSPIAAGPSLAVLGQILQDELATNYGITFHWWIAPLIGIPLAAWAGFTACRSRSNGSLPSAPPNF